jgi:murein DD-endopeptidase MepM/ murein hydrolase activator NlpD
VAFDRYAYTRNNPIKYTDPSGHGYCNSEYAVLEECQSYLPNRLASLQNHGVFLQPLDSMTPDDYFFDSESHPGQDYPNSEGSPIYAPADGVVILVDNCSAPDCVSEKRGDYDDRTPFNDGYGNVVVIEYPYDVLPSQVIDEYGLDPGESLFVLYAHLQNPSTLKPGDTVEPGQVIGSVGSTGFSTGPHLHYEVRQGATGSLPYGYMCDTICWYYKPYGNHGAKYSDWYGSGHYAAIDPLTINYIPISDYYYYGTSFTAE